MAEFIYESYVYNCIDRYSKRLLKDQKQILRHYCLIDCVVFPAGWIVSIRKHFPELWETKYIFPLINFTGNIKINI